MGESPTLSKDVPLVGSDLFVVRGISTWDALAEKGTWCTPASFGASKETNTSRKGLGVVPKGVMAIGNFAWRSSRADFCAGALGQTSAGCLDGGHFVQVPWHFGCGGRPVGLCLHFQRLVGGFISNG